MKTFVELFEIQAEVEPEAPAIEDRLSFTNYRELNRSANQLARYLKTVGVQSGEVVGIALDRSFEMITSILAVLKVGGTCLPLDNSYPKARLEFMLTDASPSVVIISEDLKNSLPEREGVNLFVENFWNGLIDFDDHNLGDEVNPSDAVYILYTSGSTGIPKGVVMPHRSMANLIPWQLKQSQMGSGSRTLQFSPLSFDVSFQEIFSTFSSGGTLVLMPEELRRDPLELIGFLKEKGIARLFLPFVGLQALCEAAERSGIEIGSLKEIYTAGEQLKITRAIKSFFIKHHYVKLFNHYGPTETHVATSYFLEGNPNSWAVLPSIGRPIANTQVYILDEKLQKLPPGVQGEIYIAGDCLADGYLNQPELSSEKFVGNPFTPGRKMYRTGDIGRYSHNGEIEFIGRRDNQVKLRGYRIELGEIEATLAQLPSIRDAVVVALEIVPGDKRLAAYLVTDQEDTFSTSELRDFLSTKLPEYMVPATFTMLESFPLTPSGKVDHQALPAPNLVRPEMTENYVAPRNSTEEILVEIWEQVIGVDRIGIHDNFLELGGDSIQSIQITSRANQAGIRLTTNQILQHQTISELAAVVDTTTIEPTKQDTIVGPQPLTPLQKWFFEQNPPEPNYWNQILLFEDKQTIKVPILEKAIRHLLIYHDALRLRFENDGSGWRQQIISPGESIPFSHIDLSAIPDEELKSAIQSVESELRESLNLTEGPLFNSALIDLGPQRTNYLLVAIHNLAVDGLSWRILLEDLDLIYQQLSHNRSPQLPSKTTSYLHWVQRLSEYEQSEILQQELPYWLDLQPQQAESLPLDNSYDAKKNSAVSSENVFVALGADVTQALLTEVPKSFRTLTTDALLTALVEVFSHWTGRAELLVDIEGHGRDAFFKDTDLSHTIGCFSTIYPVVLNLSGKPNPGEVLMTVKEQLRQVPNGGIGYGVLRYMSGEDAVIRKLQELPQSELSFYYFGQLDNMLDPTSVFQLPDEFRLPKRNLLGNRRYLLEITSGIIHGQLMMNWTFNKDNYHRATIEKLASDYMDLLKNLIEHCNLPTAGRYTPSDFPEANLNQQELDDLLAEIDDL